MRRRRAWSGAIDFPARGPRLVRYAGDGRGVVKFEGVRIESTHLFPYIGEKVHVLDGYSENWEIHEYLPYCWSDGSRRSRAGRSILTLSSDRRGRWTRTPKGGVTLIDDATFQKDGEARDHDFGCFNVDTSE